MKKKAIRERNVHKWVIKPWCSVDETETEIENVEKSNQCLMQMKNGIEKKTEGEKNQ